MDISFVVPFYKGNQYMEQLLGVVRRNAQAAGDLSVELILVNDSPDCPVEYREEWVRGFSLQILNNPENTGIHSSRINGIRAARGTFIQMLDQDDLLEDHTLRSQFACCEDADVVVANGINQNARGSQLIYRSIAHQQLASIPRFYYSVSCQIVSPGQCLIRKDSIPQAWLTTPVRCNGADDFLLWLMMHGTCRWTVNPDILYTHVDTGVNLSSNFDKMYHSVCEAMEILSGIGKITPKQIAICKRRFRMRKLYEGRASWRKALACLLYPDLFAELLRYSSVRRKKN